ncbi:MAG: right-handed parallel beta-helix repeat-containing protein, partial [Phycisphaeraceae bacterium]|nr:right-handed parallel beta-helix repeat-containing protein [Phycisphaeraceae bacterium]
AAGLEKDLHVVFESGTYFLREPLVLEARDGGTDARRVVYRAAEGAKVLISGGVQVTDWKKVSGGLWSAPLSEGLTSVRELFVAGQRRPRARFPDTGYLRVEKVGKDRRTNFTCRPGDLDDRKFVGGELLFLHDWSISRIPIRSVDRASRRITLTHSAGSAAKHYAMDHFEKHPRYAIEGLASLIDVPGEWAVDERRILYKPRTGEKINSFTAIVPVQKKLLTVRGAEGQPVRNIHFQNLHFAHCLWEPPSGGYASGQATVHEQRGGSKNPTRRIMIDPAISFDFAEDCSWSGGSIAHLGGSGLWVRRDCHRFDLSDLHVHDVSGNGLMIGTMADHGEKKTTSEVSLAGSRIERCGVQYFGAVGIWAGITRKTRITHNTVRHLPYTGISLGWRWNPADTSAQQQTVSHNHIHHVMQTLSDGGGIYTLGKQPGSVLGTNHIHDIPTNAGRAESNGMFLDQGTMGFTIRGNLIHGVAKSPLRFHQAMTNTAEGNFWRLAKGKPEIRYNNTKPQRITKKNNKVLNDRQLREMIKVFSAKTGPKAER